MLRCWGFLPFWSGCHLMEYYHQSSPGALPPQCLPRFDVCLLFLWANHSQIAHIVSPRTLRVRLCTVALTELVRHHWECLLAAQSSSTQEIQIDWVPNNSLLLLADLWSLRGHASFGGGTGGRRVKAYYCMDNIRLRNAFHILNVTYPCEAGTLLDCHCAASPFWRMNYDYRRGSPLPSETGICLCP